MAQYEGSRPNSWGFTREDIFTLATGVILFGTLAMMLLGCFHFIAGLAAVLDEDFYTPRPNYPFEIDATSWGWIHIIGGILLTVVSFAVISGSSAARTIAVAMITLSAVWNFYSIPVYPIWSLTMFGLCMLVLWALVAHGREFISAMNEPPERPATEPPSEDSA